MHALLALALVAGAVQEPDTGLGPPPPVPVMAVAAAPAFARYDAGTAIVAPQDTGRQRAIEHSDFYYKRLAVHRYASYATVPLFVTEYFLGQSLFNNPGEGGSTKSAHSVVAGAIAVLFGVNTVTGVWNLWDSRHDEDGRTRRYLHSFLMLAADAGFVWTGATAPGERERLGGATLDSRRRKHRTIAIASRGVSLASYGMMLVWKD
jgi:hypothetical protein